MLDIFFDTRKWLIPHGYFFLGIEICGKFLSPKSEHHLKGHCHENFAVLDQFCAKLINTNHKQKASVKF